MVITSTGYSAHSIENCALIEFSSNALVWLTFNDAANVDSACRRVAIARCALTPKFWGTTWRPIEPAKSFEDWEQTISEADEEC